MLEFLKGLLLIITFFVAVGSACCVGVLLISICIFLFSMHKHSDYRNAIYMKFRDFKAMYRIKPKAYKLYDDGVIYHLHDSYDYYDDITIIFHTVDAIKYFFWKLMEERREKIGAKQKLQARALEVALASMQKDINDYRERTTRETSQKVQEIVNPQQQQPTEVEEMVEPQDNTNVCYHVGADGQRYITLTHEALNQMLIEYAAKFRKPNSSMDLEDYIHRYP